MSKLTTLVFFIVSLTIYSSAAYAVEPVYKEGELVVRFAPKVDEQQRTRIEQNAVLASIGGGNVMRSSRLVPGLTLVKLPANLRVEDALVVLKNVDVILYVEPNYRIKLFSTFPDDSNFPQLWGLNNTGQTGGTPDADIDAPEAWDIRTDANAIIVAVIDTGVDYNHPDLAGNMWVNEAELNGTPGVDDDDPCNGYIDDIYGYDFCTYNKERDSDPMDDHSHGTHCAGIVGAVGDNNEGVTGVCWNVKIMALKFMNSSGYGWSYDAIDSVSYAVEMGATVLSNSWGYDEDNPRLVDVNALREAIEAADSNGVLFVASAGNDGRDTDKDPAYPASYSCENIISVMATDDDDERSVWTQESSNWGANSVDLAAPGTQILSCLPTSQYGYKNGTSMAAPHVAGACALVWSVDRGLSHLEVKDIILNTVDEIEALDGRCVSEGRLNQYNALQKALSVTLSKDDDLDPNDPNDCVVAGDYVTYTITYGNPITDANDPAYLGDVNDVNIIDYLPPQTDMMDVNGPNDWVYDSNAQTITWHIGTVCPGDSNSVSVTVVVNNNAEPLGVISNVAVLEGERCRKTVRRETAVGCFGGDIIYVDASATGYETGTSWGNAYTGLQCALERARQGCGSAIWVAAGTYKPTTNPSDVDATFELVDGVPIYGGFAGTETSLAQRNWIASETILSGDIDDDGDRDVYYVVTANDVNEATIIDGFTITMGISAGVSCIGGSPVIQHSTVKDNLRGVECIDSNTKIMRCLIETSGWDGIYYEWGSLLTVANSVIRHNSTNGIRGLDTGTMVITNNWICDNGTAGVGYGIYLDYASAALIRNNSIVGNQRYGIYAWGVEPNVTNCLIWANGDGMDDSLGPYGSYGVTYSCIQGGYSGEGNISNDPCFVEDANEPNNYHLSSDSNCIDRGDPNFEPNDPNERDIDGEKRVVDGDDDGTARVDMGGDEYYWSPADFDANEIVNFFDYGILASAWRTVWGEPNYNDECDLADNNSIDYNDLDLFCEDWLWEAGWKKSFAAGFGRGMGAMGGMGLELQEAAAGLYGLEAAIAAETEPPQIEPADVKEITEWLEELWLTDEQLREMTTAAEWEEFIKAIEESIE